MKSPCAVVHDQVDVLLVLVHAAQANDVGVRGNGGERKELHLEIRQNALRLHGAKASAGTSAEADAQSAVWEKSEAERAVVLSPPTA